MVVAAQLVVAEMVASCARIGILCGQGALLQADKAVDELEDGARRVGSLHGPVEHRLVRVPGDFVVVLPDVCKHLHIDSGA